jgi:membrane protein
VVLKSLARLRELLSDPTHHVPRRWTLEYPLYVMRLAMQVGKQWARDRCPQMAAFLAFETALTLVPLLAVISAVLETAGALSAQSSLFNYLSDQVFPAIGPDLFEHLMGFVTNVRKGALGPFGLAITLVLGYTLFHSVEGIFDQIWRVPRGRTLLSKFVVFYLLATLTPLLAGLSLYYTARDFTAWRGTLVSFGSIFAAFFLVNKLLPRAPVRWRAALVGAAVSAVFFELAKYGFAYYLGRVALARYRGVYGSVAIIPITLAWMFVGWLVILFGAECAHAAQNLHLLEALDRRARGDADSKVNGTVALRLMVAIACHFRSGGKALSPEALAERFDLDEDTLLRISTRLKARDLIVLVSGDASGLMLARPPEQIRVEDVLGAFRPPDVRGGDERAPRIDALLRDLEAARRERTAELTLGDLCASES